MKDNGLIALFFIAALLSAGCTSTNTQDALKLVEPLAPQEGIVVIADLVNPQVDYSDSEADKCLGKWLREYNSKLRFVPAQQFREQVYPFFSSSTAPRTAEGYQSLINNPKFRERILSLRVRYLIIQQEAKTNNEVHGGIIPLGGYGGGGFFGATWWNRHTAFAAQIWDLQFGVSKGDVKAQTKGTGVLSAFILPIPLYLLATEKASCKALAKHIANALMVN